jgi:glycosyltransferase involved in cell wall biosynthesis
MMDAPLNSIINIAAVVIARNEGERLKKCLNSVLGQVPVVVYVDSGSTDGSVEFAESLGIKSVCLDLSKPFTPGRARDAGVSTLLSLGHSPDAIQFIDGDCELEQGWIEHAVTALIERPDCAVVWGRLRERNPDASKYNRLCQLEWDSVTGYGDVEMSGGIALVRLPSYAEVGGYDHTIMANEDGEFCYRLRIGGWKILRLTTRMATHDANITSLGQWWRRCIRTGYAYAESAWIHGREPERYCIRACLRIWCWAGGVPLALVLGFALISPWALLGFGIYSLLAIRTYRYCRRSDMNAEEARLYTWACIVGRIPQLQGQLLFFWRKLLAKQVRLIEYKR